MKWKEMYGWHNTGRFVKDLKSFCFNTIYSPPTFEQYVLNSDPRSGFTISLRFFAFDNDNCLVDKILKFENLPHSLVEFMKDNFHIDINLSDLPHLHKTRKSSNYRDKYSQKSIEIIKANYRFEIDQFGYSF